MSQKKWKLCEILYLLSNKTSKKMLICILLLAYCDQPFSMYYWSSHLTGSQTVSLLFPGCCCFDWLSLSLGFLATQSLVPAVLCSCQLRILPSGKLMDGSCVWMGLVMMCMCVCERERERECVCVCVFVNKWNQKLKFRKRNDLSIEVVIKKNP
jgi:hypothetical protein